MFLHLLSVFLFLVLGANVDLRQTLLLSLAFGFVHI